MDRWLIFLPIIAIAMFSASLGASYREQLHQPTLVIMGWALLGIYWLIVLLT